MRLATCLVTIALVCIGCGGASETNVSDADEVLLDALHPIETTDDELLRNGALVLVDDQSEPIPSGNTDFPRFVLFVTAVEERTGGIAYDVTFGNAVAASLPIEWQCGVTRRGILRSQQGGQFSFVEDGDVDANIVFDLDAGPDCDEPAGLHEASDLFDNNITITPAGDNLQFSSPSTETTWRFQIVLT